MVGEIFEAAVELFGAIGEITGFWRSSDKKQPDPPVGLSPEDEEQARTVAAERGISRDSARDLVAWSRAQQPRGPPK